jgi:hypothetical protein
MGGMLVVPGMEALGWSYAQAEREVVQSIQRALHQIYTTAAAEDIATEAAAWCIAEDRLWIQAYDVGQHLQLLLKS